MADVRITPLLTGRLLADMKLFTGVQGPGALPIPSWLIEHRKGLVLFDTGLHADLQHDTSRLGANNKLFEVDFASGEEVSARLDQRGIAAADVALVVFSHLHFDHCGGTAQLPNARLVVQRAEWEAGQNPKAVERGVYNPGDYDLGHDVQMVEGPHDLFDDGSVLCVPTPGHTPGHQSLRVELESGPVVLTGDCVYVESMLDDMAVPGFGFDTELQRQSMLELKRMRDHDGCRMLFGHDAAQLDAVPADGLI